MKNFKHYLLLIIIIPFVLSACIPFGDDNNNNNNNTVTPTNSGSSGQNYDLLWWNLFEDQDTVQPLIDKYREQHPNVNIRYLEITEGLEDGSLIENYRQLLESNINDGEPLDTPDIITIHSSWLGRYQPKLSVSSNFTSAEIESDFFPIVTQDFVRRGSVYAVPVYMDGLAVIANVDLMAEISAADSGGPVTGWFDFLEQADRVTTRTNNKVDIAGFSGGLDNVEFLTQVVSLIMLQSNITMTQTDELTGFPKTAAFEQNPESEVVLNFYKRFYSDRKTWDENFDSEVAAFLSKKLSMYIAPSWRLNDILRLNTKYNLGLNPEVFPVPQINDTDPNSFKFAADYWGLAVTRDSQTTGQSSVAWDFIKFLTQDDQQRLLNEQIRQSEDRKIDMIYAKKSLASEQKSDRYLGTYINSLEKAQSWDMVDGFLVDDIFRGAYSQNSQISVQSLTGPINTIYKDRLTLITNASQ